MTVINTSDIGGGDNDYATITLWEADTDNDLVTAETIEIGILFATGSPYQIALTYFSGAITSALYYRHLKVEEGDEHDGTLGAGVVIEHNVSESTFIACYESYFQFSDIEFDGQLQSTYILRPASTTVGVIFNRCLIHSSTLTNYGLLDQSGTPDNLVITFNNCAFSNVGCAVRMYYSGVSTNAICNYCTAVSREVDADQAYNGFENLIACNCAAFHFGDTLRFDFASLDALSHNNASSDGSGSTGLQNLTATDQFVDITDGAMDLHLKAGSDLLEAGLPINILDDVKGFIRSIHFTDIGFHELGTKHTVSIVHSLTLSPIDESQKPDVDTFLDIEASAIGVKPNVLLPLTIISSIDSPHVENAGHTLFITSSIGEHSFYQSVIHYIFIDSEIDSSESVIETQQVSHSLNVTPAISKTRDINESIDNALTINPGVWGYTEELIW